MKQFAAAEHSLGSELRQSLRGRESSVFGLSKLRSFCNALPADRSALIRAWFTLTAARLGLALLPFQRVMSVVPARTRDSGIPDRIMAGRLSWAVQVASDYVPSASCVTQAVALQMLLHREGIGAELKFSVARDKQGELAEHAWVESHGRVLIGSLPV